MRLKAFGLADENESNRLKRKASRFKEMRDKEKLAKQAKMDEGEDSSSLDGPSKGINPQSYQLTPEQFQAAAIEFVANMAEESSIEERAELTRRVITETKTTKEAPADKPGPKVPEPNISRPDTDSQEKVVKVASGKLTKAQQK